MQVCLFYALIISVDLDRLPTQTKKNIKQMMISTFQLSARNLFSSSISFVRALLSQVHAKSNYPEIICRDLIQIGP